MFSGQVGEFSDNTGSYAFATNQLVIIFKAQEGRSEEVFRRVGSNL